MPRVTGGHAPACRGRCSHTTLDPGTSHSAADQPFPISKVPNILKAVSTVYLQAVFSHPGSRADALCPGQRGAVPDDEHTHPGGGSLNRLHPATTCLRTYFPHSLLHPARLHLLALPMPFTTLRRCWVNMRHRRCMPCPCPSRSSMFFREASDADTNERQRT